MSFRKRSSLICVYSSKDYLSELHNLSVSREASTTGATVGSDVSVTGSNILSHGSISSSASMISEDVPSVVPPATSLPGPSITSFLANIHALATSRPQTPVLDPDDDSIAGRWHEQESWTAQISRKEHPKDPTSLLSLRDVLRNKPSFDSTAISSRLNQIGSSASRLVKGTTAKPTVEVSEHVVDAIVVPQPENTASIVEKLLRDAEENIMKEDAIFAESVSLAAPTPTSSTIVGTTLQTANNGSVMSSDSNATIRASTTTSSLTSSSSFSIPPPVPPKTPPPVPFPSSKERFDQKLTSENRAHDKGDTPQQTGPGATTSTMGSLTSHLATAMRYVLSSGQTEAPSRPETPTRNHHPLLAGDSPAIDERPHIKYEWVIGKRLKFSCTVFYAKQFDSLRRRCGVDELLVQSLKRSENWTAEGRSTATFPVASSFSLKLQEGRASPIFGKLLTIGLSSRHWSMRGMWRICALSVP
jgi:1-phosphatidylinositol-3-phosphate 5-kinase